MIELQHLTKRFATQGGTVVALNDINLTIRDGDVYGIIGMSGAGKSTLVRCINMLERPDEGNVIVNGKQMQDLRAADLRAARREITMIFQQFNLLMQRTCLRNIMFPMELAKVPRDKAEARARELLELVGLPDKADAYPAQLSGGQKQRIAIARALATDPKVLLCDEATSALDPQTTNRIEIHDIEPFSRLVRGRVALLGDAGHSTTPDIGQGGCAAMEDAVVLGTVFRQTHDIAAALREYEAQRCDRVRDLVLKARKRCDITHGKDMQLTEAWYQELREETGERIINGMCDTILSGPLG